MNKHFQKIAGAVTALIMCCTLSGSFYSEIIDKEIDISSKFSPRLMQEYGVSEESLKTPEAVKEAQQNPEKVPVLIWCTDDIDHTVAEQKALPVLTENIKVDLPLSSVDDVLISGEELSAEAVQEFIEKERAESRAMYEELNGQFVKKYMPNADIAYVSQYSPVVLAELTFAETVELAESSATLEFDYCGTDGESNGLEEELDISTKAIKANKVYTDYGYTGAGVKIGQLDSGIPKITNSQLSPISSQITCDSNHIPNGNVVENDHATAIACILIGKAANGYAQGVAPNAKLYSTTRHYYEETNVNVNGTLPAIEWLLSQNVNVINASLIIGDNFNGAVDALNTYGARSKWLDHIATDHYVTFVKSAGNQGTGGITSGGMAYNVITVGNVDDKNTETVSDDELWSGTDKPSSYYHLNTGLAYKPDLCAPGTNITVSSHPNPVIGTSASAPHVVGTIALLFQAEPALKLLPATVKAILTASVSTETTKRYCPSSWTTNTNADSYAKYGAGLLDAFNTIKTAENEHYYSSNLNHNKNEEEITMNITSANSNIRVSLAYLKNNYWYIGGDHIYVGGVYYTDLPDLDLYVYAPDGSEVGHSATSCNNVEIVDFTSAQAGAYKIKVKKYGSSLTETVNYGVSWLEVS